MLQLAVPGADFRGFGKFGTTSHQTARLKARQYCRFPYSRDSRSEAERTQLDSRNWSATCCRKDLEAPGSAAGRTLHSTCGPGRSLSSSDLQTTIDKFPIISTR